MSGTRATPSSPSTSARSRRSHASPRKRVRKKIIFFSPALSRGGMLIGRGAMALLFSAAGAAAAAPPDWQPAQTARLEGEVVDETGAALEGATIAAGGTSAISDANGSFALVVPLKPGEATVATVLKTGLDPPPFQDQLPPAEPPPAPSRLPPPP